MELYLFREREYAEFYNCSLLSDKEWDDLRQPNPVLGFGLLAFGALILVPYVLSLIFIRNTDLYAYSSYKIMFYLGITDVLCIIANSAATGYFAIIGAVACTSMDLQYLVACLCLGLWANQCATCVVLAINRCVQIADFQMLKSLFKGRRTYAWIVLCALYGVYVMFEIKALTFSSVYSTWFFDPYVGIDAFESVDRSYYTSTLHTVNNAGAVVVLLILNVLLVIQLRVDRNQAGSSRRCSKIQNSATIQSFFICLVTIYTSLAFLANQFVTMPSFITVASSFSWQLSNAAPGLMYILINRTIRVGVAKMLRRTNKVGTQGQIYSISLQRETAKW